MASSPRSFGQKSIYSTPSSSLIFRLRYVMDSCLAQTQIIQYLQ